MRREQAEQLQTDKHSGEVVVQVGQAFLANDKRQRHQRSHGHSANDRNVEVNDGRGARRDKRERSEI
jgi:hypothetical protein